MSTDARDPQTIAEACAAAMWAGDRASQHLGMTVDAVGPGTAVLSMTITETMANGHGIEVVDVCVPQQDTGQLVGFVVASVVLGCFTNFLNNVADTDLDIPMAEPIEAQATSTCGTEACANH